MNTERLSAYEQLSLEAAARVDAVCDGFEQAWKAARSGAAAPCLSSFLDDCEGPERTVLAGELLLLDRACREHYGFAVGPEDPRAPGAGAHAAAPSATHPLGRADVPVGRPEDWPSIPGLELVEVLGSGGMGVVFKARQATLDRDVAARLPGGSATLAQPGPELPGTGSPALVVRPADRSRRAVSQGACGTPPEAWQPASFRS
jgi:eukaryotic-like serine/threonine-protein kinase